MSRLHELLSELEIEIDPQLLDLALVHRSYSYEHGGIPTNERLEFLGDAILGVIVTVQLYVQYPDLAEGRLARLRAAVVNARTLAQVARDLEIGPLIKLGKGEVATRGDEKDSILSDTVEALIAAIHLSGGIEAARAFVHHLFNPLITEAAAMGAGLDWKTSLQEFAGETGLPLPRYDIDISGPDHDRRFTAYAVVGEQRFGPGEGKSKKQAEQQAARIAFEWVTGELPAESAESSA